MTTSMIRSGLVMLEILILYAFVKRSCRTGMPRQGREFLRLATARARSGLPAAVSGAPSPPCLSAARRILVDAERRGLRVASPLRVLGRELTRASRHMDECARIRWLFFGRSAAVTGLALLVRGWLAGSDVDAETEDIGACAAAGLLMAAGQAWFAFGLPRPWLWDGRMTPSALQWLSAIVRSPADTGAPWASTLGAIRARELRLGVSLEREILHTLVEWARQRSREVRADLQRVEDMLPLFELITIGVPAGLLLLVPILEAFAGAP